MSTACIGRSKWDLDTPALLLDLDCLERNIARIAERCRSCSVDWRPHTKGNKTPAIAHKMLDAGAVGITCAKLGEAEVMAAAGIRDILVANQVVGEQKLARLVSLRRQADVMVAIDDAYHVDSLSAAAVAAGVEVRVLVEIEVGMQRCGVAPGEPALELAKRAAAAPGVIFAGVMGYEGHAMIMPDDEKRTACEKASRTLKESRELIEQAGLPVGIVSTGGTGTLAFTPSHAGITEIQAGGGVLLDSFYPTGMNVKGLENALTILTTVVSRPEPERAYVDSGKKTTNGEYHLPTVLDREGVRLHTMSAETGYLELEGAGVPLKIGEKLELISGYSDLTVCLHDVIYGTRDDRVEAAWDIQGRGKLQ